MENNKKTNVCDTTSKPIKSDNDVLCHICGENLEFVRECNRAQCPIQDERPNLEW